MPPVVPIGFDAENRTLATRLAAEGRLPVQHSLMEQDRTVEVESPHGLFVGAAWPTFFTGVNTARHGRYCFAQLTPGTMLRLAPTICSAVGVELDEADGSPHSELIGS